MKGLVPKQNKFYITKPLGSIAVLQSDFGDLPQKEASGLLELSKVDANIYGVFSGSTNFDINAGFGEYNLTDAKLSMYVSGTDLRNTSGVPPELNIWNVNPQLSLTTGSFTLPTATYEGETKSVGDKLTVVNTSWTGHNIFKEEQFSGDPLAILKFKNHGSMWYSTATALTGPSGGATHAVEIELAATLFTLVSQVEIYHQYVNTSGSNARVVKDDMGRDLLMLNADVNYYYVIFDNNDYPDVKFSREAADHYGYIFPLDHFGLSNNFGSFQGRSSYTQTSQSPDYSSHSPSVNDTIFDTYRNTMNFSNPYDADDNNPLLMSSIEVTQDKVSEGNQSLRFYHNWGAAAEYNTVIRNSLMEKYLGGPNDANCQVAMAGMYNIPLPQPIDAGYNVRGDRRTVLPHISMDMLIEKLGPCPQWAIRQSAGSGTRSDASDADTATFGDPAKAWLLYDYQRTSATGNLDISTTTSSTTGYIEYENNSLSTLRCVAIVFSNFKPLDTHRTLDDFLEYGMRQSYGNKNTVGGILGGVIIRKLDIDGSQDESNSFAYAQALPVTRNPDLNAPYGSDSLNGYDGATTAGDVGYYGMVSFVSGTQDTPTAFGPHLIMNSPLFNSSTRGNAYPEAGGVFLSGSERQVALPLNQYFNMKFYIDAQAVNWTGSSSLAPYKGFPRGINTGGGQSTLASGGVGMRVVFDTTEATSVVDNALIESRKGQNTMEEMRFLDIPFPVGDTRSSLSDDIDPYTFLHTGNAIDPTTGNITSSDLKMFPKHMTVWVQNYRWIKGNTQASAGNASWFKNGDDTVYSDPVSMEAEVYLDNVKLVDFTPPLTNMSASQDNYYRGTLINNTLTTPFHHISGTLSGGETVEMGAFVSGSGLYTSAGPSPSYTSEQGASYQELSPGGYLMFGFDEKTWMPQNVTDGKKGYLLMSNFGTSDWPNINQVLPALSSGAIFSLNTTVTNNFVNYLGNQYRGDNYRRTDGATSAADAVFKTAGQCIAGDDMASASAPNNGFAMGNGANTIFSTDGLSQKGFIQLYVSGTAADAVGYTGWHSREHILASTKITAVPLMNRDLNQYQIQVADPSMFNINADDEYIIYMAGTADSINTTYNTRGYTTSVKLVSVVGNTITFDKSIIRSDGSASVSVCTEEKLSVLWVCPKKYWATMQYKTDNSYTQRSFGQFALVNETPSDSNYNQLGSTFNEWYYHYATGSEATVGKSAVYTNTWDINTVSSQQAYLITDYDYGHGAFDEENGTGGYVAQEPLIESEYLIAPIKGIIDYIDNSKDNFNLFVKLEDKIKNKATIVTPAHATSLYHPQFIYEYADPIPEVNDFTVSPTFNLLDSSESPYNLTHEDLNSVTFNWKEQADDVWYRYMIINDTGSVANKYESCRIHVPLNDAPSSFDQRATFTATNPMANTSYTVDATGSAVTSYTLPYSQIDGLAGWAPNFAHTTTEKIRVSGTNSVVSGATTFSIVCHAVPDSSSDANNLTLFSLGGGGPSIGSKTGIECTLSGNKLLYDQKGLSSALTGTTYLPYDGETPINVIVVFDEDAAGSTDLNVYLNGKKEMSATGVEAPSGAEFNNVVTGSLYIGGRYDNADPFHGQIEEFCFYDSALVVCEEPNEKIYSTINTLDLDSNNNIAGHLARLFVFDYHNIRGTSAGQVAESNSVTWRATTL